MLTLFNSKAKSKKKLHEMSEQERQAAIAEVEEIHNAVDESHLGNVEFARNILLGLEGATKEELLKRKAERMRALGFNSAKPVTFVESKKPSLIQKTNAKMIARYTQRYPDMQFLTEEQMESICKKYNLMYAPVSAYKGDIPENNLVDIELAGELHDEDQPQDFVYMTIRRNEPISQSSNKELFRLFRDNYVKLDSYTPDGKPIRADEIKSIRHCYYKGENLAEALGVRTLDFDKNIHSRQGLFIAGPSDDFNTEGLTSNGGSGLMKVQHERIDREVPAYDPIVFRFIQGGVQIITKWGLEAEDPIFNQD